MLGPRVSGPSPGPDVPAGGEGLPVLARAGGVEAGGPESTLDVGDHGIGIGVVHVVGIQRLRVDLPELAASLGLAEPRPVVDAPAAVAGHEAGGLRRRWNIQVDMSAHNVPPATVVVSDLELGCRHRGSQAEA